MPAERRSFTDPIDQIVYLDTSFVIHDLFQGARYHADCQRFRHLMRDTGVLPVISDFVLDELAFWVMKQGVMSESQRTRLPWRQVLRNRRDLAQTSVAQASGKRTDIEGRAVKLAIPDSVTDRAFQLMHDYVLLPTDAYHIATAMENEVTSFATLDQDFLDVEEITVYTCLP